MREPEHIEEADEVEGVSGCTQVHCEKIFFRINGNYSQLKLKWMWRLWVIKVIIQQQRA